MAELDSRSSVKLVNDFLVLAHHEKDITGYGDSPGLAHCRRRNESVIDQCSRVGIVFGDPWRASFVDRHKEVVVLHRQTIESARRYLDEVPIKLCSRSSVICRNINVAIGVQIVVAYVEDVILDRQCVGVTQGIRSS